MSLSLPVKEKILYGLDIGSLEGVEIGPLANPLVSKSEGKVHYVDRASTEEIIEWYRKSDVPLDKIVAVDHIWGEETLSEATGAVEYFDYCIASHVIEHVPDLISWVREIAHIIKDGGVACFSIPDRRHTFDYFRPETVPADLLEAYFRKLRKPAVRHIFDHFSSIVDVNLVETWTSGFDGSNLARPDNVHKAYAACLKAVEEGAYIDSHCWVFTSKSFIHLLEVLSKLGLLDFRIRRFFDTEHNTCDFVIQLEKIPASLDRDEKHRLFMESLARTRPHIFRIRFESSQPGEAQVYYDIGNGFSEQDSVRKSFSRADEMIELELDIPPVSLKALRFDPAMAPINIKIESIDILLFGSDPVSVPFEALKPGRHIRSSGCRDDYFYARSRMFAKDPYLFIELPDRIKQLS
ncbi:MAG: methyltransferase domain-containing protein [Desulfobulbaceae bacterium]|nr:methyltransferase domain-containing protein [Desulfobulbaceae bacterium]